MVWVKEGWSSEAVSVEKDEILLPRKFRPDPEGLAVYSLGTRSEKLLPLSCTAVFSSNANHTPLHLCDIAAYLPNVFPCKACIVKENASKCVPSNVVTLRAKTVAPVLVCSALSWNASVEGLPLAIYYVPPTLPHVEVVVIERPKNCAVTLPTNGTDALPTNGTDTLPTNDTDTLPTNGTDALPTSCAGAPDVVPLQPASSSGALTSRPPDDALNWFLGMRQTNPVTSK